jgi:FxsC-like protein
MANRPPGKIVTFYSYKGGTGRSMALANVAWILASQGKRVLMLDWDLEAPGLHRYFHPFLVDKELTSSDGLIDFVLKFAAAAATPTPSAKKREPIGDEPAAGDRLSKGITVYLAETASDVEADRETVKDVLQKSGYTVLPDQLLPDDPVRLEAAVRDYLKRAMLSIHLIGRLPAEGKPDNSVLAQNALAAERDNEPNFSRLIWLPQDLSPQPSPRRLLLGEPDQAQRTATLLQAPLDQLFKAIRERTEKEEGDKDWYKPYANILRYASSLDWPFKDEGVLDLIPAGRQGPSYSTRVNSFNWQNFYDRLGGGVLLELAKERMRAEYDYILIDSRTGVSDTSGICTVQMPDILVVCFTLNNQSIEGAGAVAASVYAQRRDASGQPDIRIFPVPTRVEKFEKQRLELSREAARARFDHLLWHLAEDEKTREEEKRRYWGRIEIFYEPFYAYEELLATFGDKPLQTNSLLASTERLVGYLTDKEVTQLEAVPEIERQIVLAKYSRQQTVRREPSPSTTTTTQRFLFYLGYSRRDDIEMIEKFFSDFSNEIRMRLGLSQSEGVGFLDNNAIETGDHWDVALAQALENSRVLVALYSPAYFKSDHCGKEFQYFSDRMMAAGRTNVGVTNILPIIWIPVPRRALPEAANRIQLLSPEGGLRRLMRSSSRSDKYAEFLDDLAGTLTDMTQKLPPEAPHNLPSFKDLRNAFEDSVTSSAAPILSDSAQSVGGPRAVKLIYVVARPEEMSLIKGNVSNYADDGYLWRPFFPADDEEIGVTGAMVATNEMMVYEVLPFDDNLLSRVRSAEQNNSPVILIVDPWVLRLANYQKILSTFDEYAFINCAVLIVWNEQDLETTKMRAELEMHVRTTFPNHLTSRDNFLIEVRSREELHSRLSISLQQIRARIIERGQVMKPLAIGENFAKPSISRATDAE